MANRIWQAGALRRWHRPCTPPEWTITAGWGERPSNPELLDYLATTFMENGWSIKKMNRMIMLSKTYQMSAVFDEEKKSKDAENRLVSHFPRQRLSIEEIRDAYLAMGGELDLTMGGTLDPGVGTDGETSASRISMNSRVDSIAAVTIYLPLRRSNLPISFTRCSGFRRRHVSRRKAQPYVGGYSGAIRDEQPAGDSRGEESCGYGDEAGISRDKARSGRDLPADTRPSSRWQRD